jgi:hypothetical protein
MPCALVVIVTAPLLLRLTNDNDPDESTRIITKVHAPARMSPRRRCCAPRHHDLCGCLIYLAAAAAPKRSEPAAGARLAVEQRPRDTIATFRRMRIKRPIASILQTAVVSANPEGSAHHQPPPPRCSILFAAI